MRVSFVDDEPQIYPLQYGGKARTVLALAQNALSHEAVDEVTVMSRSIEDERDSFTDYGGVRFERLDDHNMIGKIVTEVQTADILSVHTCSFTFPRIPLRKATLIYHLHDVMQTTVDKGSHLDKALAGDWDVVVSPSDFATRTYQNFAELTGGSSEVHTIPRGINPELFHEVQRDEAIHELRKHGVETDDTKKPILFFPGRPAVGKGDDRIKAICDSLAEQYDDFLVVTTSDLDSPKQHKNVMHVGWQRSDMLKYFYSVSDLTLSLSKLPESFSQVCIESVACGTPVLAFPFGNLEGLSWDLPAIRACEPTNNAIVSSVNQMLINPDMRQEVNRSQAIIEAKYSIGEVGKTYVQLYMDIARRRKEALKPPELYFLSPFAIVRGGSVYLSDSENSPLQTYKLTETEELVLTCCAHAKAIEEIRSITGLGSDAIHLALKSLRNKKVIIGGNYGRNA